MRTAPFLFITNMAMLPESARTAAAYLGGGIARGIEKQGKRVTGMSSGLAGVAGVPGQQIQSAGQRVGMLGAKEDVVRLTGSQAAKTLTQNPLAAKVGGFLESLGGGVSNLGGATAEAIGGVGQSMQQFGQGVATNAKGAMAKRDVGLAAAGAAMTGAFVGGMGANSGIHALMGYQMNNPLTYTQDTPGTLGGNIMPSDLQASYIALNQLGSPLGLQMLRQNVDVKIAQDRQRMLRTALLGMMGGEGAEN